MSTSLKFFHTETPIGRGANGIATQAENILDIRRLSHRYGSIKVLNDISLTACKGEFVSILGPSGSGKSTLLRNIAGLEVPTSVETLTLEGKDVSRVPANRRHVSTVFQHFGLFPHLTVGQNVEYGLKVRKVPPAKRRSQAESFLELVKLDGYYDRSVHQLSGGQQQRVALARSLVLEPAILLLDEPLGALDEKLRIDMQVELLTLQKQLGMTFIYVTHSQEEALTMSDRILLMNHGMIVQEGIPQDLFDHPICRFAAEFMGMENIFPAKILNIDGAYVSAEVNDVILRGLWTGERSPRIDDTAVVAFRAEKVRAAADHADKDKQANRVNASIESRIYKGKYMDLTMSSAIGDINLRVWDDHFDMSAQLEIKWQVEHTVVMPFDEP